MNNQYSFPKSEHLCGEKRIGNLFNNGKSLLAYPFRIMFSLTDKAENETVSLMISVSKKRFKLAVKRNRIKRLIREVYRLNKHILIDELQKSNLKIDLALNYIADEEMDFASLDKKMKLLLAKLNSKISEQ